jgi:hypothetical protein
MRTLLRKAGLHLAALASEKPHQVINGPVAILRPPFGPWLHPPLGCKSCDLFDGQERGRIGRPLSRPQDFVCICREPADEYFALYTVAEHVFFES